MSEPSGLPSLNIEGYRATIRLNRPELHNRIEPPDIAELGALLRRVNADRDLRVVVLTATGRSFSSGFNISEIGAAPGPNATPGFEELTDQMEKCRLPTICALNGGVYGGATDLALACDFRIGVDSMAMFMPAARLGLHYYPGGMRRYVSRLGVDTAKRLFLLGQKLDATELLRIGFLTDLVPRERLAAATDTLAETLAANAPLAVQGMKKALNDLARGEADFAEIEATARVNRQSADLAEGQRAWMEKRPARFIGA
jgi:enoyl-CoA hydratase